MVQNVHLSFNFYDGFLISTTLFLTAAVIWLSPVHSRDFVIAERGGLLHTPMIFASKGKPVLNQSPGSFPRSPGKRTPNYPML